jgi:serine/threonine protein kinase
MNPNIELGGHIAETILGVIRRCSWKGEDKYIIKISDDRLADHESAEQEQIILKDLVGCSNIVKMKACGKYCELFWTVLEFAKCGDLFTYINDGFSNGLSQAQASHFFADIVSGVAVLHSRGYAHNDLSLENILVMSKFNTVIGVLSDFGMASHLDRPHSGEPGKSSYASPERLRIGNDTDPIKHDIWAIGIILHILITNHALIGIARFTDVHFSYLCEFGLPRLIAKHGLVHCVSKDALRVMKRCLRINPDDRWTMEKLRRSQYVLSGRRVFYV